VFIFVWALHVFNCVAGSRLINMKLVGATAHYINNDLDEGPIIAQGVEVVDLSHYPEDLIAKGRDIEGLTLARAVGYHIERRVFLNANRTVVL